jgi:hypothetical protein
LRRGREDLVVYFGSAKNGRGRRRRRFVFELNSFGLDRHSFLRHSLTTFRSATLELPTRFSNDVSLVRHHRFGNVVLKRNVMGRRRSVVTVYTSVDDGRFERTVVSRNESEVVRNFGRVNAFVESICRKTFLSSSISTFLDARRDGSDVVVCDVVVGTFLLFTGSCPVDDNSIGRDAVGANGRTIAHVNQNCFVAKFRTRFHHFRFRLLLRYFRLLFDMIISASMVSRLGIGQFF